MDQKSSAARKGDTIMAQVPAIGSKSAEGTLTDEKRQKSRRVPVRVRQLDGTTRRVAQPLGLPETGWRTALQSALGTTSQAFVEASLQRLIAAAMLPGEPVSTTVSVSAALALVQSLEPENEAQAALAINAACLHAASANVMSRLSTGGADRRVVMLATATSRLERAFHNALDTYYRLKRGHTQVIRVEKLEVQPGGQAVVGTVQKG
jgi:hypothetical protein